VPAAQSRRYAEKEGIRMARIPAVTRDALQSHQQPIFDTILKSRGRVGEAFGVFLNSPEVARNIANFGHYLRYESTLPPSLRELVILTVSWGIQCEAEWSAHEAIARQAGVRPKAMAIVRSLQDPGGLTEDEAMIVRYSQELVAENRVSEGTFQKALGRFGAQGTTELTATVGYYVMIGLMRNALEV
jgi:4-carboxymuconolactone decarboxylase